MNENLLLCYSSEVIRDLFAGQALPSSAHAGLVFDRFLNIWHGMPNSPDRKELYRPLTEFVEAFNKRREIAQFQMLLEEFAARMDKASEYLFMDKAVYAVQWRLACGLGNDHPTENGFSFDPIVGVPVLTGSSIKGLCRATAKFEGVEEKEVCRLFGPENISAGESASVGELCFYDAYPLDWPKLCVDIVNCHHTDYYTAKENSGRSSSRSLPLETESPNPVFFLAVEQGAQFVFRVASRKKSTKELNIRTAFDLLERGLSLFGIGAKTAVGYGVFDRTPGKEVKFTLDSFENSMTSQE